MSEDGRTTNGLGKSNDRVDEDVGLTVSGSSDSQLSVSPVPAIKEGTA
jgi:hypothetical protein